MRRGQGQRWTIRIGKRRGPSVVVSKFATFRYRSPSELRNQNDTRNQYVASVLSIPKFAKRRYRDVANFGIGTLVSWFRSSPHSDIDLLANFETKTTLGINTLLVSFRFRNSLKGDIEMLRISESGH